MEFQKTHVTNSTRDTALATHLPLLAAPLSQPTTPPSSPFPLSWRPGPGTASLRVGYLRVPRSLQQRLRRLEIINGSKPGFFFISSPNDTRVGTSGPQPFFYFLPRGGEKGSSTLLAEI